MVKTSKPPVRFYEKRNPQQLARLEKWNLLRRAEVNREVEDQKKWQKISKLEKEARKRAEEIPNWKTAPHYEEVKERFDERQMAHPHDDKVTVMKHNLKPFLPITNYDFFDERHVDWARAPYNYREAPDPSDVRFPKEYDEKSNQFSRFTGYKNPPVQWFRYEIDRKDLLWWEKLLPWKFNTSYHPNRLAWREFFKFLQIAAILVILIAIIYVVSGGEILWVPRKRVPIDETLDN